MLQGNRPLLPAAGQLAMRARSASICVILARMAEHGSHRHIGMLCGSFYAEPYGMATTSCALTYCRLVPATMIQMHVS